MTHKMSICLIVLQFCFLLLLDQTEAKVSAVIVFGDSSVDAGNNDYIHTIGRSNFPPYGRDFYGGKPTGRFCNGRLSTDFISEAFGIKPVIPAYLDPAYTIKDFATGVTFASAGTGLDNVTSDLVSVIPFWKEIEYFKEYKKKLTIFMGAYKTNVLLREAFYILSIGTNDFLENYYQVPTRSSHYTVDEYENFLLGLMSNFVWDIYKLGARKIALTSFTAFGCLPLVRTENFLEGRACNEDYNKVARELNVKLNTLIIKLNKELKGIKVVYSGVYDTLVDAIQKPSSYGFENVANGCCGTGLFETSILCNKWDSKTCKDASKYIFWDSIHYSEKMNKVVSDHAMKTAFVPFL
ncbi:GDSL esterase/lipase [Thalictrum thalictroides]|uniref:GDSL esterase/lipase n=1 Tax=Thalictrum thalictroides TaxID=46969 RepID=A0A7J6VVG6_THATH|nr:GDSL esterase/lipase [Thalictrum thalictroides]